MTDPGDPLEPRANPNLYGHEAAERTLLDAWRSGRLAHAWLICGPRGIGKATLAFRFARFVLAGGGEGGLFGPAAPPEALALAPDHPVFRRVAAAGHADLLTVQRTLNDKGRLRDEIVVEDARAIPGFLHLTPAEGGWRVVVIDAADEMNRSAANAVLKIIEEPPRQSLVLLVSHAPGRLLRTIRSRCRLLALQPLPDAVVRRILAEQRPALAAAECDGLVALAEGSAGRALALADQDGLALWRELLALLGGLPRLDVIALHRLADRTGGAAGAAAFQTIADLLLWWLARLIKAGGTGATPAEILPGEAALHARLAAARNLDRWLEVWEKAGLLFARADGLNLERKQVMLTAFLALEAAARP